MMTGQPHSLLFTLDLLFPSFRFTNSLPRPALASPPQLNRSNPHCQLEPGRAPPNITRMLPTDRLDSTHFVSYPSLQPEKHRLPPTAAAEDQLIIGVASRPSSTSGRYAEEYRLIDATSSGRRQDGFSASGADENDEILSEGEPGKGLFQSVDFEVLRVIFLGLDALLLLHRITNVYVGVRLLSRRFGGREYIIDGEEYDRLQPAMSDSNHHRHCGADGTETGSLRRQHRGDVTDSAERSGLHSTVVKYADGTTGTLNATSNYLHQDETCNSSTISRSMIDGETGLTNDCSAYHQFDKPPLPHQLPPPAFSGSFGSRFIVARDTTGGDYYDVNTPTASTTTGGAADAFESYDVIKSVVARMLQSGAVPKAIVAVVLTLVFYIIARSAIVVLDGGLLTAASSASLGVRGRQRVVDAIEVRVNESNRCIEDEARQLNELATVIYGSQLRVELVNLRALVEYFNVGEFVHFLICLFV